MNSYSCCEKLVSTSEGIKELSALLKLVGEENRLRLLYFLKDGEHCVCEFSQHLDGLSQSLISHHLADLKEAKLIESRKQGLRVYYKLTQDGEQIVRKIFALRAKTDEKSSYPTGSCARSCPKGCA